MTSRFGTPAGGSPAEQVETDFFRALAGVRAVVTAYAVALNVARFDEFARPWLAVLDLVVLVGWAGFVSWAYEAPHRRRVPLFVADLAVAVALMLSTPLVQSQEMLDRHASTMPSFAVIAPVLAWAAARHWAQALGAALVVSVADVSVRTVYGGSTWGNIFLLLLLAGVVGWTSGVLRRAAEMRAAAERAAAVVAERARLARAVHDGVLQVLALVQRRGAEAGGELAALGRLAAEQEVALRSLVQADALSGRAEADGTARVDLMVALTGLATANVTVTGPGVPVLLGSHQVQELAAAVAACLDNVRCHVGEESAAWVFVEDLGGRVEVSVRDEGPGIPEGRLTQAVTEGRIGVVGSVRGRMADLGGRADLVTGPGQGVEWLLTLPRTPDRGEHR